MATVDTITAYLNLEIPNRPAATGGAFTAGRMLRATGVGKFVEQRTPAEVLADIGAVNKDGTTAYTGTGDGFSDDETFASDSAVSTVSERAILAFVEGLVGVSVDYFFNDTVSDIGGIYYNMTDAGLGGGESTLSTVGLGAGDDQPLVNFATLSGFPGIQSLRSGIYVAHIHAEKTTGTRSLVLYAKVYKRTTGGTETLIVTTHVSAEITSEVEVTLHANLTANMDIDPTDRIVVKWFANIGSSGSAVTVALRQEGDTAAHLDLPTTSDILSHIFVRQDGTEELSADWDAGSHKITAEQLESDIASGTPPLVIASTDAVANLNADLLDGNHASAFAASGHSHDIDDLNDVTITTPALADILIWNTANWINVLPSAIGIVSNLGASTDNHLARFNGTTGKLIQDSSPVTLTDAGAMDGLTQLDVDNVRLDGNTVNVTDTNGDLNLQSDGTGVVIIGVEGDTVLGTPNLTVIHPGTTGMVDLGKESKTFGDIHATGEIHLNLPTSNPGPGILWADGGTVKVGT